MTFICLFNISSLSHNFITSYIFWNNSTPYTEMHIFLKLLFTFFFLKNRGFLITGIVEC